jgi:uncharacterized OB-fold protein
VTEVKQIPIGTGLFTVSDGKPNLMATHCKSCGDYFFPKSFTCHNPKCKKKEVEEVILSRKGTVAGYTVMNYPPPPPFIAPENYQPIPVVEVKLPEGIHLIAMMEGCDPKDVKIGMDVEMVMGVIYTNKNNEQVMGWKYKRA